MRLSVVGNADTKSRANAYDKFRTASSHELKHNGYKPIYMTRERLAKQAALADTV